MSTHEKLIIIGSGPAGYTAAVYAARAELTPLLFEGEAWGGQLMWTTEVENFPGFPGGMQGPELMAAMRKQSERFGTRIVSKNVTHVDLTSHPKKVTVGADVYEADAVILATGAEAIWLGVPGEETYKARGVSACATCDGFFFKGKDIAVVGGGDSAMEEANFLTKFANSVTVLVRKEALKASKIMQERAEKNPKIRFVFNTEVTEVLGDGTKITGVKALNNQTKEEAIMPFEGLFMAIGHKPNTDLFKGQLELDKAGYIITTPGTSLTKIEGVFAAGDVQDHLYRQAITAAGSGCMAALDAERWLARQE